MTETDSQSQAALDEQLRASQRLLHTVTDAVQRWKEHGGRPLGDVGDVLIQSIFARSTRTYEAVVEHLGNRGFAEQGAMLNRSLFEDMVDARWVSLNSELAAERLRLHDRYSHALRLDVQAKFPEYLRDALKPLDPPMTDAEQAQARKLFGRYGDGPWTGVSLYDRFKAVESTWPQGLGRRQADFIRAWVHRLNNETLHLSSYSLARLGSPTERPDGLHLQLGATTMHLPDTLWCAVWTYAQTCSFVFERFELAVWNDIDELVLMPALKLFADALVQSGR